MIVTKATLYRIIAYTITIIGGLWSFIFIICFGTESGRSFFEYLVNYPQKSLNYVYLPILHLAAPVLLSSVISVLLLLSSQSHAPDTSRCYQSFRRNLLSILNPVRRLLCHRHYSDCEDDSGNSIGIIYDSISFESLSFIIILVPCSLYGIFAVIRHFSSTTNYETQYDLAAVANSCGIVSVLSMSWFLVPVTSHGPILKTLGWSEIDSVPLHIWAGNIAVGFGCLHGLLYFIDYLVAGNNIIKMFIPPSSCWSTDGFFSTPPNVADWCHTDTHFCSCRMLIYNFTGVLSVLCFIIVFLTSLHRFRRRYYAMFIKCHFIFGALALLTLICHWPEAALYLSPSIVYYMATGIPVIVAQWRQRFFHRGVRIRNAQCLEESGRCVALTLETTTMAQKSLSARACLYVKVCIPRVSAVWHPFTIIPPMGDDDCHGDARIVLRAIGPFTKAVEDLVMQEKLTSSGRRRATVLVDGFYGQEPNRLQQALRHDTVVMIAGGVGVTPHLSLSQFLLKSLMFGETVPTGRESMEMQPQIINTVVLHWVCRDKGLITYFEKTFFWQLQRLCDQTNHGGFQYKVIIYHTNESAKDNAGVGTLAESVLHGYMSSPLLSDEVSTIEDENNGGDEENNVSDDGDVNIMKDRRIGITPPCFIAGERQSLKQNLPATILISLLSYLSLVILYNGFMISRSTGLIYDRLNGILVAIIVAVLISIVADVIMKLFTSIFSTNMSSHISSSSLELTITEEEEGNDQPKECCNQTNQLSSSKTFIVKNDNNSSYPSLDSTTSTTSTDEDISTPPSSLLLSPNLSDDDTGIMILEHRYGRPDLAALFQDVANESNNPGVFMCGPKGLLDEAKRVMMLNRSVEFSVYEEIFEV